MRSINLKYSRSYLEKNDSYQANTLEQTINKMIYEKEPIDTSSPIIYTARVDGVLPEYDIRTDRFDVALELADKTAKARVARRTELMNKKNDTETVANTSD